MRTEYIYEIKRGRILSNHPQTDPYRGVTRRELKRLIARIVNSKSAKEGTLATSTVETLEGATFLLAKLEEAK